ncbi:MAG: hypothetical protein EPN93_15835 [Spirochaetes bacterium]|nr:MAG: hypothetical protein EPN93_15835 [Spirochaetota bacterium]
MIIKRSISILMAASLALPVMAGGCSEGKIRVMKNESENSCMATMLLRHTAKDLIAAEVNALYSKELCKGIDQVAQVSLEIIPRPPCDVLESAAFLKVNDLTFTLKLMANWRKDEEIVFKKGDVVGWEAPEYGFKNGHPVLLNPSRFDPIIQKQDEKNTRSTFFARMALTHEIENEILKCNNFLIEIYFDKSWKSSVMIEGKILENIKDFLSTRNKMQ